MSFSKEQRFFYGRIAILAATAGWIVSAFAAFKGFPLWYSAFAVFFWVAFGLLNFQQKSSFWLLMKRPWLFLLFYAVLACVSFLAGQFGINAHLWFYPFYGGWKLLLLWFVLYPFGGLAILDILYFLGGRLGEPLQFLQLPLTKWHSFFDACEHLLFLLMFGVIVAGAVGFGWIMNINFVTAIITLWIAAALVRMRLHIRHSGHYTLIIVFITALAMFSHELPNTIAREWTHLDAQFLNFFLIGVPFWMWISWFWFVLVPLRLWIFLVLHPKVR